MTDALTLPFLEPSEAEARFLAILEAHRGMARAISVAAMAEAIGVSGRAAQEIKKHLVEEHGVCIGSSCGEPSGWYLPETEAEIEATVNQYKHRLISLARLIARTKRSAPAEILGQIKMDLEARPHAG